MHRGLVHIINAALISIVLVGIPAVTSLQMGKVRLTSTPEFQLLTFGGLAVGAALNFCGTIFGGSPPRRTYGTWMLVFGTLLAVHWGLSTGQIQFDWLKDFLLGFGGR